MTTNKELEEFTASIGRYAHMFSDIEQAPHSCIGKQLATKIKNLESLLRDWIQTTAKNDLSIPKVLTAKSIIDWYLNDSQIRPLLSIFIRHIDKKRGELEFEKMRFRLADRLKDLENKLRTLTASPEELPLNETPAAPIEHTTN